MPPRKSDARKSDVSAGADARDVSQITVGEDSVLSTTPQAAADRSISEGATSGPKKGKEAAAAATGDNDKTTIEDLTLPKSIITRLAKGVLPANTQIQANAVMAMSKSTTVFISYLAAHANEITLNANKKTIMPADVFKALEEIEFDFLKEPLEAEFAKFNAIQTDKRNNYRQKVKAAAKPTAGDDTDMRGGAADSSLVADTTIASAPGVGNGENDDDAPPTKKARVEKSGADADETEVDEGEEDAAEDMDDDEDEDDEEEAEEEEDEEDEEAEEEGRESSDETQDALEERVDRDEADEALDGDESD